MNLSLLNETSGGSWTQWILPAVLLILIVVLFVTNQMRSKKMEEKAKEVINTLKVGTTVKTYSGFYGKIVEISETTDGKVAVLETGSDKNKGYVTIDMNAIYGIDNKQDVVYDVNGNPVIAGEETVAEEKVEVKEEPKVEEKAEEVKVEEVIAEETPVKTKKTTAKKSEGAKPTEKKTTAKKTTKKAE